MHHLRAFTLLLVCLILAAGKTYAQEEKLGKIDKEVVEMTVYPGDSSAHAVVLFDVGFSYYNFTANGRFTLEMTRHRRVKILDTDGFGQADVEIPFYDPGSSDENVSGIKGYTFYMQDGKVEKVKLDRKDIFKVDLSNNWKAYKFTMPNVTPGAVIEFEYKINSDYLSNLRPWVFQEDIPVIYSEYKTQIPEFFRFQKVTGGYLPFADYQTGTTPLTVGSSQYISNIEMFVMKDLPAFRSEKFISSPKDYLSKVEYQLASTQFPGQMIEKHMGTWPQMNSELLDSEIFGKQINRGNFLKDAAAEIAAQNSSKQVQMVAAMAYIKSKVKWNGNYHYASKNIKKIWDEGEGDSGDINLLFIALLRELGFAADPVIGSTRDNGRLNPMLPLLDRLNYVVALVEMGEGYLLLDATSNLKPGMLPFRCLNGEGWRVSESKAGWIRMDTGGKQQQTTMVLLQLDEEGKLIGNIRNTHKDYTAALVRSSIRSEGEESYRKSEWEENENIEILEYKALNLKDRQKPLTEMVKFEYASEMLGNRLYLTPFVVKMFEANIFKKDKRYYPIDFGSPIKITYSFSLQLPEGYEAEETPEAVAYATHDQSASFVFQTSIASNIVQISATLNIEKPIYLPEEYEGLRELFTQLIGKQEEQLVIKNTRT